MVTSSFIILVECRTPSSGARLKTVAPTPPCRVTRLALRLLRRPIPLIGNLRKVGAAFERELKDLFIAGNIEKFAGRIQNNGAPVTEAEVFIDLFA